VIERSEIPEASPPPLESRRLRLRPVGPADHPFLYDLATSAEVGWRWRYRGYIPRPETFSAELGRDQLVQFMIDDTRRNARAGLVDAYGANLQDGFAYLSLVMAPAYMASGWGIEALLFFMNYVFTLWGFRKLYAELPGFNYQLFASGEGKTFRTEACLRDHHYYQGRYWDHYVVAAYRDDWLAISTPSIERLRLPTPAVALDEGPSLP